MENKSMRFLLVGNGPMGNRGCQAIEMSTINLVRKHFSDAEFLIGNMNGQCDEQVNNDPLVKYFCLLLEYPGRKSLSYVGWQLYDKLRCSWGLKWLNGYREIAKKASECDVVLSLGGDLYARTFGPFQMLNYVSLGLAAVNLGKPFIIWPATLGPFSKGNRYDADALDALRQFSLIFCRDQYSLDHLSDFGINQNTRLVADPAFLLEPKEPSLDNGTKSALPETLGINIAPYQGPKSSMTRDEWVSAVTKAIESTYYIVKRPILLIPHVVKQTERETANCDFTFMAEVQKKLLLQGIEIPLLPATLQAPELKWIIGHLRAFIGARTHSTIAAFGSATPCGCIGHSAKAGALCETFYGSRDLLLPITDFSAETLPQLAVRLLEDRDKWHDSISERLPKIKELAASTGTYLFEYLMNEKSGPALKKAVKSR